MRRSQHVLTPWLLRRGSLPGHLVPAFLEHTATSVVWVVRNGPASVGHWRSVGVGAISDAEVVAGLLHSGSMERKRRSSTAMQLQHVARAHNRDIRTVDVRGNCATLETYLPLLEGMLFAQKRSGVLLVQSPASCWDDVRTVLQRYAHERGAAWKRTNLGETAQWPSVPRVCKEHIWRQTPNEVVVFHRCTHTEFAIERVADALPTELIQQAADSLELVHARGKRFVEERLSKLVASVRKTVPAHRNTRGFRSAPIMESRVWAERLWDTMAERLEPDLAALRAREDLRITGSSGTSTGISRVNVMEHTVFRDRYAAETSFWGRIEPWRVAIINRPANLFDASLGRDEYMSKRTKKDARLAPGTNPTDVPDARWRRLARDVVKFDPTTLASEPQYLMGLSRHLGPEQLPALRSIFVATNASWSFQRRQLEQHFRIPITQLYNTGEVCAVGVSCRHGTWHLLETYAHYEVFAGGRPAKNGQRGQLVATTFDSRIRPLLRYPLGDIVSIHSDSCPCGRQGRGIVLEGRAAHTFRDGNGTWVTPLQLDRLLSSTKGVRHLCVERTSTGVVLLYVGDLGAKLPTGRLAKALALPVSARRVRKLPVGTRGGKLKLVSVPLEHALRESDFLKKNSRVEFADLGGTGHG